MTEQSSSNPEISEKETQLQRLKDVAENLLSSESREYLELDVGWSVENTEEIMGYIVGELQGEGHDFEEVFEQAGITIEFDPDAPYVDE